MEKKTARSSRSPRIPKTPRGRKQDIDPIPQLILSSRKSAKIERSTPLYEQIQEALWDMIISGRIAPGQHISDRLWADNLNVSRTPVREAMRQMARDGALLTLESGGYQVRPVDRAGLLNLYICRSVLASAAVRETTRRADKRLIKKITETVNRKGKALKARDAQGVMNHSSAFHDLIISGSNNEFLIRAMDSIKKLILFYRITLLKRSLDQATTMEAYFRHLNISHKRHEEIVTAIENKDAEGAARLMEAHLLTTSRDMDAIFATSESINMS